MEASDSEIRAAVDACTERQIGSVQDSTRCSSISVLT